jgi:hypothetical protein
MALAGFSTGLHRRASARRGDLYGIASLVALAVAFLAPAAKDGPSVGGFDFDTTLSPLGSGVYSVVHAVTNGDAVSQMVAWNDLSWRMVHVGQFPLWNQFSALGMPQFLNFESSVLSLPDLLSYLVPVRFAFLVVVFAKLLIASTGAYVFARVLRCGALSATLAGASFMLAGAFSSWLTWPLSDVFAWSGWILAFGLLCLRPEGKLRHVAGLAIVAAFSIYGGFPEANVMFAVGAVAFVGGAGIVAVLSRLRPSGLGAVRTASGLAIGGALSAPLWFPGLQVISISHRESEGSYVGLPTRAMALLFSQGYYGLPTGPHPVFQLPQFKYYEAVTYVGVVAVVLAIVAIGTSIRRPVVAGLTLALVVSLALTYQPVDLHPLQSLVNSLPYLKMVRFERMRTMTSFLVAVLAALGLQQLIAAPRSKATRTWLLVGATTTSVVVAYLDADSALKQAVRHVRVGALVWPTLTGFVVCVVAIVIWRFPHGSSGRNRITVIATGLVALQTSFLFFAGVGIFSYSTPFFQVTPAIAQLQAAVGKSLLGLNGGNVTNVRDFRDVGFYPNVNIGYSIRIFGIHDPLIPATYFQSWPIRAAAPNARGVGLFVPDIDTVALAQRYGIAYVLTRAGIPVPTGMQTVAVIAGETLSKVPDSSQFSFVQGSSDRVRSSSTNGNGTWQIATSGTTTGELALRVTVLPGFHATIDGKPLGLHSFDSVMMEVRVPPGRHEIVLHYFPRRLELGLVAAATGLVALIGLGLFGASRRRRSRKSDADQATD